MPNGNVEIPTSTKVAVSRLMTELAREQIDPSYDISEASRADKIRSEILKELKAVYSEAILSEEDPRRTDLRDEGVGRIMLDHLGTTERPKKDFGKRVFRDQCPLPSETVDIHHGRFSKRMLLPYSDETRRQAYVKDSSLTVDKESIFSPRNKLLRSGELNIAERRPCFHVTTQGQSLPGILPSPRRAQPQEVRIQNDSKPLALISTGRDRPLQSQSNHRAPPKRLRECRTHNNHILEVSPRGIPTVVQRLDRIYKT
jgi:hypothetical protein